MQVIKIIADGIYITSCAAPIVDHIDLIAGDITGKIDPSSPDYTKNTKVHFIIF